MPPDATTQGAPPATTGVIGVVVPEPLDAQCPAVEFVGALRNADRKRGPDVRFARLRDRLADSVAVQIDADAGPVVSAPLRGFEVRDAAQPAFCWK